MELLAEKDINSMFIAKVVNSIVLFNHIIPRC